MSNRLHKSNKWPVHIALVAYGGCDIDGDKGED